MKSFARGFILLSALLLCSSLHSDQSSTNVSDWLKKTLMHTFEITFAQQQGDLISLRSNYTNNAWNALTGFLGGYIDFVKQNKLTIHPFFGEYPQITETGTYSGIHYWRLNQQIVIPELKVQIGLSIVVLLRSLNSDDPYVIQSMDIIKQPY